MPVARMRLVPLPRDGEEWFLLAVAVLFLLAAGSFAWSLSVPLPYILGATTLLFGGLLLWLIVRALIRMDKERQAALKQPMGSNGQMQPRDIGV